jgi:superfamily II DNA helicase RecQ
MTAFDKSDVRHQPAYALAEAARYLKLPQATLRAWVVGRDYPVAHGHSRFKALIKPARSKPPTLSFYNLIEAHVLRALRTEHGVSLKALRSSIAREEKVPSYVVFTDRTLAELAARKPRNSAALLEVHGVGQAKLDRYGERFLAAIKGADETEAA